MDDDVLDWEDDDEYAAGQLNLPAIGDANGTVDDEGDDAVSLGGDEEEQEYYGTRTDTISVQNNSHSHESEPIAAPAASAEDANLANGRDATAPSPASSRVKGDSHGSHAPSSPAKPSGQSITHALPPKPVLAPYGRPARPLLTEAISMSGILPPKRQAKSSDLLPDWEEKTSSSSGDIYFYNVLTHVSQWARPTARPSTPPPIGYEPYSGPAEDRYRREGSNRRVRTEAALLPTTGHNPRIKDSWVAPDVRARSPADDRYQDRSSGLRRRESRRSRRHDADHNDAGRIPPAGPDHSDRQRTVAQDHSSGLPDTTEDKSHTREDQEAFALALSKIRHDAQHIKRPDTQVSQGTLPPPRPRSPPQVQHPSVSPASSQPRQRQSRFGPPTAVVPNVNPLNGALEDPLVPEEFITPAPDRSNQSGARGKQGSAVDEPASSEAPRPRRDPLPPQSAKFRSAVKPPPTMQPPPPAKDARTPPRSPERSSVKPRSTEQRPPMNGGAHTPTEPRRLPDNVPVGPRSQIPLSRPEPSAPASMYPNRPIKDKAEDRPRDFGAPPPDRQQSRPGRGRDPIRPRVSGTNNIPIGNRKPGASNGGTQSPAPMGARSCSVERFPENRVNKRESPPRFSRDLPVDTGMDTYIPEHSPQDRYRRSPEPRDRRRSPRRRTPSPPPRRMDSRSDRDPARELPPMHAMPPLRKSVQQYEPVSPEPTFIGSLPPSRGMEQQPSNWERRPNQDRGYAPPQNRPHGLPMKPVQSMDFASTRPHSPDRRPRRNSEAGGARYPDDDKIDPSRSPHDEWRNNKSLLDRLSGQALPRSDDPSIPKKRLHEDSRQTDAEDQLQGGGRNGGRKKRRRGGGRN